MSSVQNSPLPQGPEKKREKLEKTCPYLDTINRNLIDFDFEKLCSISLATQNVYACLVCGRYFQGRGPKSHAYTHSLQLNHYVFLNLETKKFYCLPENYEFFDTSLEDIIYLLDPKYAKEDLEQLNTGRICRAFDGSIYHPGIIGVNNIKANDYSSVVLLALAHITIIRDYFLHEIQDKKLFLSKKNLSEVSLDPRAQLVLRFGQLLRKIWNMHLFKSHISPHEMLQLVSKLSKGKFQFTKQSDPLEFIVWFMNNLDAGLKLLTGKKSTLISKNFSGSLRVTKQKIPLPDLSEKEVKKLLKTDDYQEKQSVHRFYTLPIDLPAVPLYPNQKHDFQVPKQSLSSLLKKFDGKQIIEEKTYREIFHKKFTILDLPKYLIIFYKRFTKNYFVQEKLSTIIDFPLKNISFFECLSEDSAQKSANKHLYNVMANIICEGDVNKKIFKVQLYHPISDKWFEIQDLFVKEILPQEVMLSEAYIQILERKS